MNITEEQQTKIEALRKACIDSAKGFQHYNVLNKIKDIRKILGNSKPLGKERLELIRDILMSLYTKEEIAAIQKEDEADSWEMEFEELAPTEDFGDFSFEWEMD